MAEDKEIKTEVKEEETSPEKNVAKKPAAKKTTKKKTTSKKTTAKKTSKKKTSKKSSSKKAEEAPKVDVETEEDKKAKKEAERKEKLKKMKVKAGDMVFVDVLGKTVEDDDPERSIVFQASNPEDAKLLINYDAEKSYQYVPDMAIVGKTGFVADKIDAELEGMKFFEEKTITLEAKDAFGEREGKKIEKVSIKQFKKDMNGEEPHPGSQYNDKKGRSGLVLRANQGRLIVDFNHPLAGKKVSYRIKVVDKIEGMENRVKAFIERRMPGGMGSMMTFDHDKESKTLNVEVPQALAFQLGQQGQQALYFKFGVAMDFQEYIDDVDTVKFIETYEKPPAPAEGAAEHDHDHDHEGHDHDH